MRRIVFSIHTFFERLLWVPMTLLAAIFVLAVGWSFDRDPPARYEGDDRARVFLITPGKLEMSHRLKRNRHDCDVTVNRWITFEGGLRQYYAPFEIKAAALRLLSQESPDIVRVILDVPEFIGVGSRGMYGVQLSYVCNPLHNLYPIEVQYTVRFTVEAYSDR